MVDGVTQVLGDHVNVIEVCAKIKPHHFLVFATGASQVPATGWPAKPSIIFEYSPTTSYIKASTCGLRVTVPISESNKSLEGFVFAFGVSLAHGATFSKI